MDITGIGSVATLANTVIGKIWPDKTEQEKQELAAAVMVVQGQIETNKAEAASPSVFVSGWRPSIGWVCSAACAWNWIGLPIAKCALTLWGHPIAISPADISEMMPILMGIAILSSVAWLVLIRSRAGSWSFSFLALATLAYVSVAVLTRTINVPINDLLMTWNASSPPPNVMEIWARWEQVHTVRTFVAVIGFAFELLAFGTSPNVPAA